MDFSNTEYKTSGISETFADLKFGETFIYEDDFNEVESLNSDRINYWMKASEDTAVLLNSSLAGERLHYPKNDWDILKIQIKVASVEIK